MGQGNCFLPLVGQWAKVARRHFLNPELLELLFVTESNFLAGCTETELRILHRRWGQEMFEAVTAGLSKSLDGLLGEMLEFPVARPETPAQQLYVVGTTTPFLGQDSLGFGGMGGNIHRLASAARDHLTTPFLHLFNWSEGGLDFDHPSNPLYFQAK